MKKIGEEEYCDYVLELGGFIGYLLFLIFCCILQIILCIRYVSLISHNIGKSVPKLPPAMKADAILTPLNFRPQTVSEKKLQDHSKRTQRFFIVVVFMNVITDFLYLLGYYLCRNCYMNVNTLISISDFFYILDMAVIDFCLVLNDRDYYAQWVKLIPKGITLTAVSKFHKEDKKSEVI